MGAKLRLNLTLLVRNEPAVSEDSLNEHVVANEECFVSSVGSSKFKVIYFIPMIPNIC